MSSIVQQPEMIGRTVGKWRLRELLGEGAFGAVYRGEHTTPGGPPAAVKILMSKWVENAEVRARFFNEARAAVASGNQHIVTILDVADPNDPICYLAMQLLKGRTLEAALKADNDRMGEERVRRIAAELADALFAAHAAGVIHRDLKPANVFLAEVPDGEFVKVLDFGIAKLMDDPLTRVGEGLGSRSYQAPEQFNAARDADSRADIYALGVVIWELLTGSPTGSGGEYLWARPDRSLLGVGVVVSRELDRLVQRMVEVVPERRPSSMRMVAEALRATARTPGAGPGDPTVIEPAPPPVPPLGPGGDQRAAPIAPPPPKTELRTIVVRQPRSWIRAGLLVGALLLVGAGAAMAWALSSSSPSLPPSLVALGDFALDAREATFGELAAYQRSHPGTSLTALDGLVSDGGVDATVRDRPANLISRDEAAALCAWKYPAGAGHGVGRLPTSAEWTIAAQRAPREVEHLSDQVAEWISTTDATGHPLARGGAEGQRWAAGDEVPVADPAGRETWLGGRCAVTLAK